MKKRTRRSKYIPAVIAGLFFLILLGGLIVFYLGLFSQVPEGVLPFGVIALFVGAPAALVIGVLLALFQRLKEIKGGEEDDASQY